MHDLLQRLNERLKVDEASKKRYEALGKKIQEIKTASNISSSFALADDLIKNNGTDDPKVIECVSALIMKLIESFQGKQDFISVLDHWLEKGFRLFDTLFAGTAKQEAFEAAKPLLEKLDNIFHQLTLAQSIMRHNGADYEIIIEPVGKMLRSKLLMV